MLCPVRSLGCARLTFLNKLMLAILLGGEVKRVVFSFLSANLIFYFAFLIWKADFLLKRRSPLLFGGKIKNKRSSCFLAVLMVFIRRLVRVL